MSVVNYTEPADCSRDLMVCFVQCILCLTNATGACLISTCELTATFASTYSRKKTNRNPIMGRFNNNSNAIVEPCPFDTFLNLAEDSNALDSKCTIVFSRPTTCDFCSASLGLKVQTPWAFNFDKKTFYIVVGIVTVAFCFGLVIGTTCTFCRGRRHSNAAKSKWSLPLEKDATGSGKRNDHSQVAKMTKTTLFSGCSWPTNISDGQMQQKNVGKMDT
uniref:Uncharacterized protein n=1 Tax=Romanomermis culicivorax TaxID=13658 RepID=A0A915I503_ROMCU